MWLALYVARYSSLGFKDGKQATSALHLVGISACSNRLPDQTIAYSGIRKNTEKLYLKQGHHLAVKAEG